MTTARDRDRAGRQFPFPSSFQFRTDEKATLEAFFENVFFEAPLGPEALAAMTRIRWRREKPEGTADGRDLLPGSSRHVLLCRGADGIGKTRIFRHLRERARARQVPFYEVNNYDVEGIPLKPFAHALRRILEDLDDSSRLGSGTALLDRYCYALESLLPEAFEAPETPGERPARRRERLEAEKVRVFDGIAQLLLEVAAQKPLLILMHDLHWADRATVELVRYIGRNLQLRGERPHHDAEGRAAGEVSRSAVEFLSGPEMEDFGEDWRVLTHRSGTPLVFGSLADGERRGAPADTPAGRSSAAQEAARRAPRLMILANYRGFSDPESCIEQGIESLGEEPFAFHIELRPLDREEAGRFLEKAVEGVRVAGSPLELEHDAAGALIELSEGFPSFQQELFRGVYLSSGDCHRWSGQTFRDYVGTRDEGSETDGAAATASPRRLEILRRRIEPFLTEGEGTIAGGVLGVLAMARRPVGADLIASVLASDDGVPAHREVRQALEALEDQGIVECADVHCHHFRLWDYVRVVEEAIPPPARSRIHQRIGEECRQRIEDRGDPERQFDDGSYEVFYHLSRGEAPVSAVPFGKAAAERFERTFALEKAREVYQELAGILADEEHLAERIEVLCKLAEVSSALRDYDLADATFQRIHQEGSAVVSPSQRFELLLLEAELARATDPARALKILGKAPKFLSDEVSGEGARLYLAVTQLRLDRQDWKRAINYGLKGIAIAQKLDEPREFALLYQHVARAFYRKGDYTHAVDNYQRGLEVAERRDDRLLMVDILDELGRVYLERGSYFRSARYLYKALEMRQRERDVAGLSRSYDQLALVYRRDGDYHKTIENLHRSLHLKQRIGDFAALNPTLGTLGDLYFRLGHYQRAIGYFQLEVENSRRLKQDPVEETSGLSDAFVRLGRVYYEVGDLKHAENLCKQVLILAPEYKLRSEEADALLLQGNLQALRRDWGDAEKSLKQAAESFGKLGHRMRETCALLDLSEVKFQREYYDEALKLASKAHLIAEDVKALDLRVRALTIKGNVHRFLKGGNGEKVRELLGKALEMSQHLSDVKILFQLFYSLAKVFHIDREFSEASNYYGKAEALLRRIADRLPEDLQARYFDDPRRKVFAEDAARFRQESQGRTAAADARERVAAAVDLRERPPSPESYKALLERILRVNQAMNQLYFPECILAEGLELAGGERGFLVFVRNREYQVAAAKGFGIEMRQHPEYAAATQVAEDAIRRGRCVLLSGGDDRQRERLAPLGAFNDRSVIAVPLMTSERIFGGIFIDKSAALGRFTARDQSLLEAFAWHVGVALQNRRNLDIAIREPLTGFYTPSYFIERLREEYRLFNLHGKSFALAGFYLPVLEDSIGEAGAGLGEKLAREIEEVFHGAVVSWGSPILFILLRDTDLSAAEECTAKVQERLEAVLNEEVPLQVLGADRRYQHGSDIYFNLRRRLLPEECDHKTLTELRRLLARDIKLKDAKKILEKHIIESTLRKTGGNITHAARELGIHRPQLSNYLKKYGLKRELYERELDGNRIDPVEN